MGLEVHRGLGKTGVVGVLRGAKGTIARAIGLRADMDALPMPEHNRFELQRAALASGGNRLLILSRASSQSGRILARNPLVGTAQHFSLIRR